MMKGGKYPRPNFTVRKEWTGIFEDDVLTDAQIRLLVRAMFSFQNGEFGGKVEKSIYGDPVLSSIWKYTVLPFFVNEASEYQDRCRKNAENASKRWAKDKGLLE